ncbi:3-dehydroquinate synthase [Neolewinella aurantiaca]|uniref:3-dehydroquinate synthase n=1 Tax=Neolewinella aurantiaca TaxID=2602767 RepID=A0A5C7FN66_9BACT|nr:3-dehydroquinate synthase [Neolewinella aurantiaca]TXF87793.1 3-dehydroquinate synthase [Neolewinella aurantiaca]
MILSVANKYEIQIGTISQANFDWLSSKNYAGWVLFADENTAELCLPRIEEFLPEDTPVIVVPEGELNKNLETCQDMWEDLFAAGVGRRWCAICLGGGVLEDMAGFVSSTYKRGIDFLQIPTTLLSMVDSSVGGKLGIDFNQVKNSIGVFNDPIAVWIDPVFLETLPLREIRSGYGEIIKHGLIADRDQWDKIKTITDLSTVDWETIIPSSVNIKREIVLEDPFEKGLRKALNFGHTIGHAIESYWLETDLRLFHGEAVAAGMIMESWLSTQLEALSSDELREITDYCLSMYGHQSIPEDSLPELLALMQQDKKNEDHRVNFTLLSAAGKARINATAEEELIVEAIRYYNGLAHA